MDAPMASVGDLQFKVTLGERARGAPALANDDDRRLLLAWIGPGILATINVMPSDDAGNWTQKVPLTGESTPYAPAVAASGGRVFVAWTADDFKRRVNLISTADSTLAGWDDKITFPESSGGAPALAAGNGSLFLAWIGFDKHLNLMRWDGRAEWSPKQTLSETSGSGPALTFHDGKLYLLWTGTDRARSLNAMTVEADGRLGAHIMLTEASRYRPGLAFGADGLPRVAWTGVDDGSVNVGIFGAAAGKGLRSAAADKSIFGDTAADGPALCAFQGRIAIAWTGTDRGGHINTAELDGGTAPPQTEG
jgi:hypothetical protein